MYIFYSGANLTIYISLTASYLFEIARWFTLCCVQVQLSYKNIWMDHITSNHVMYQVSAQCSFKSGVKNSINYLLYSIGWRNRYTRSISVSLGRIYKASNLDNIWRDVLMGCSIEFRQVFIRYRKRIVFKCELCFWLWWVTFTKMLPFFKSNY